MTRRTERINEQLQQELGLLLLDGVKDPRVGAVTLTGVEVSPDLSHARVFYTLLIDDLRRRRSAQLGLDSSASFLRRALSQRLHLRRVPELEFRHDATGVRGDRVDQLLTLVQDDVARATLRAAAEAVAGPEFLKDGQEPEEFLDDGREFDDDEDFLDDDALFEDDDEFVDEAIDDPVDPGVDEDEGPAIEEAPATEGDDSEPWLDDGAPMEGDEEWVDEPRPDRPVGHPGAGRSSHGRR